MLVSHPARFFWLSCLIYFHHWHHASSQDLSTAAADPWQIVQTNHRRICFSSCIHCGLLKHNLSSKKNGQIIHGQIIHTLHNLNSGFVYRHTCTNEWCPNCLQVVPTYYIQLYTIWKLHSSFSQHTIETRWLPSRGD